VEIKLITPSFCICHRISQLIFWTMLHYRNGAKCSFNRMECHYILSCLCTHFRTKNFTTNGLDDEVLKMTTEITRPHTPYYFSLSHLKSAEEHPKTVQESKTKINSECIGIMKDMFLNIQTLCILRILMCSNIDIILKIHCIPIMFDLWPIVY
jgi:hypothetical protein